MLLSVELPPPPPHPVVKPQQPPLDNPTETNDNKPIDEEDWES